LDRQRDFGNDRNARVTAWHGRISHEEWGPLYGCPSTLVPIVGIVFWKLFWWRQRRRSWY